MKVTTNAVSFLQVYQNQWASISQVYSIITFGLCNPPATLLYSPLPYMLPANPEFISSSETPQTDPSVRLIPHSLVCCCYLFMGPSLPKREYNSLSLSDVHPYALFLLTARYDCASIFFLQCPWIRAVTAHMPFCVWMETGHCRADKLLLVLLVMDGEEKKHQKSMLKELFIPNLYILNWRKTTTVS